MGNKVGVSMVTLTDLNDAIIAGEAPLNPTEGTLWIDSSLTPPVLKKWSMGTWVTQVMDLTELDPEFTEYISKGVDAATTKLGNLSSDDKITATERQVILDKLTDMLGSSPSGTVPLPAVATVNTYTVGEYYQTRKSATDAGVGTSDTAYTAYANAYTTLANYLNTILADGIYCWDVSNAKVETVHTIVGQTFRDNWKAFYQAQLVLQTRTSKRVSDAKAEAEAYTKSYREQLVGNGYAGVASNRNFSGFTYTTAQKVTGPGSFSRTATGETRTDEFIAVEADRTYRLMVSVINSTTTGTHNIGLECYNAAGTSLGKRHILRSGTNNALPSTTSFVHYEGVISGLNIGAGAVTDTDFPAGTTQVKVYFNTNIGTTTNTIYVADVSFALENIEANKDYNGISLSALKGMVVTSTRNVAEFNATDGIKIYKKTDVANPVFKLDSGTGDLTIRGNIYMQGGTISWANMNTPSVSDKAVLGIASPDDVKTAVGNIKVGGRNYYKKKSFSQNSGVTAVYNETENEWTLTFGASGTGSWRGLKYTGNNAIVKPGETATVSFDIYTDYAFTMYPDINNLPVSTGSGANDNDVLASRVMPKAPVVGQWTRLFFQYTMPANLTEPYYDNSVISVDSSYSATAGTSFKIKNIQYEIGNTPTEFSFAVEDVDSQIKAVQGNLDNLKVGGRNLLRDSGRSVNTNSYGMTVYPLSKTMVEGTEVTISLKGVLGAGKTSFGIYNSGGNVQLVNLMSSDLGADGVYRKTFPWRIGTSSNVNVTVYHMPNSVTVNSTIEWIQLEEGNKATDWTPAPEDDMNKLADLYTLTNQVGGVTVVDANKIQTGTLDATKVNVNNLNATNITSGTLNVSRLNLKGLTVSNGLIDTFKVDGSGNVTINGNLQAGTGSNMFTKNESGDMAVKANIIGIGAKYDYGTFTLAATNKIYFHGYAFNYVTNDQQPADVDGYFYGYDNSTKITAIKGVLDLTSGVPAGTEGYIIYDSTVNKWGFGVYDAVGQSWRRYNVADSARHNISFTWTTNLYIMGELIL